MSIESIAAVAGPATAALTPALTTTSLAPPVDLQALGAMADLRGAGRVAGVEEGLFDRLVSSLGEIDSGFQAGGRASTELALGQSDNLHQVMIAGERTRMQFELAMSMRNRVLEAYQEIMRMQV
jgi:flagellar hook-basal body complex protein FliE